MRIIVAGAGMGGLVAAWKLGELGHTVDVYEKETSIENMRYDWHDDLTPDIFEKLGLTPPKENFAKPDWTFVAPFEKSILFLPIGDSKRDMSIERRPLNALLYEKAKAVANIHFGKIVEKPILEGKKVVGCVVDGQQELCDLLIDSLGAFSALRTMLPKDLGIETQPKDNEIFYAFRGYFNRIENAPVEEPYTHRVYMKHLGKQGISWCALDHNPKLVDVLVGHVGSLSDENFNKAITDLRNKNPWLGDKIARGGFVCKIPVRRPLSKMVADGYVAIGDSAFMTIPMLGSGMVPAMLSALILADVVSCAKDMSAKSLWKYQIRVFKEFGAQHCGIEVLKNGILDFSDDLIAWLFGSGIVSAEDMAGASIGKLIAISPSDIPAKLKIGWKKMPWLLKLNSLVSNAWAKVHIAEKIPTEYDEDAISKWQMKIDK